MKPTRPVILISAAFLAGCSSPDQETMKRGLAADGLTPVQASCYSNVLSNAIGADEYNYLGALLANGESRKNAIKRTRRKHGSEFKTAMNSAKQQLDACLKKTE